MKNNFKWFQTSKSYFMQVQNRSIYYKIKTYTNVIFILFYSVILSFPCMSNIRCNCSSIFRTHKGKYSFAMPMPTRMKPHKSIFGDVVCHKKAIKLLSWFSINLMCSANLHAIISSVDTCTG